MNTSLLNLPLAARELALVPKETRSELLRNFSAELIAESEFLLSENKKDLAAASQTLTGQMLARLKLDSDKIKQLAQGILAISDTSDPIGEVIEQTILDDGLILDKVRVPLGVVGVIFESRPDVFPQLVALAIRSGNALALKGGKEARNSNEAFFSCLRQAIEKTSNIPSNFIALFHDREIVSEMLKAPEIFSLIIPRGSYGMVRTIMEESLVPVLGHADGICHVYIHSQADLEKACEIVLDSKIQYPTACNAVETLLVDKAVSEEFLTKFFSITEKNGVKLKGSNEVVSLLPKVESATEEDWTREYSDLILNVKIIGNLNEAVEHINRYGSHHTDSIVSENQSAVEEFLASVDSACVFANCSTRFSDGFRFGLGAEIGIGTGKVHARGPVGIEGLLTYKYKLRGSGQKVSSYVGAGAKEFKHNRNV